MKSLLSALVLSLCALGAFADDLPAGFRPWTEVARDADANGDALLTPLEIMRADVGAPGFRAFMSEHFMEFDTNRNGMLSMKEMKAGIARMGMSDAQTSEMFFRRIYDGL